MTRRTATQAKKTRHKSPTWLFGTHELRGEPRRDTDAERAEKERAKAAWLAQNPIKKLPERKPS